MNLNLKNDTELVRKMDIIRPLKPEVQTEKEKRISNQTMEMNLNTSFEECRWSWDVIKNWNWFMIMNVKSKHEMGTMILIINLDWELLSGKKEIQPGITNCIWIWNMQINWKSWCEKCLKNCRMSRSLIYEYDCETDFFNMKGKLKHGTKHEIESETGKETGKRSCKS